MYQHLHNPQHEKDDLLGKSFGVNENLTVTEKCEDGAGRGKRGVVYIAKCSVCSEDKELFPDTIFYISREGLLRNNTPCGCSRHFKWSEDQYKIRAQRKALELGISFLGFSTQYIGCTTKCILSCQVHGLWESTTLDKLLNKGVSCKQCRAFAVVRKTKPDNLMIERFNRHGVYAENTMFSRADRINSQGRKSYWNICCGSCGDTYNLCIKDLHDGIVGCRCSKINTIYSYIFNIQGLGINCLKFGISSNPTRRIQDQIKKTSLVVDVCGVWKFTTSTECRTAEKQIKMLIPCRYLSQEQYPDGWTETTSINYIDDLVSIYEKHGGVRVQL